MTWNLYAISYCTSVLRRIVKLRCWANKPKKKTFGIVMPGLVDIEEEGKKVNSTH
jgi:hypothetical protein